MSAPFKRYTNFGYFYNRSPYMVKKLISVSLMKGDATADIMRAPFDFFNDAILIRSMISLLPRDVQGFNFLRLALFGGSFFRYCLHIGQHFGLSVRGVHSYPHRGHFTVSMIFILLLDVDNFVSAIFGKIGSGDLSPGLFDYPAQFFHSGRVIIRAKKQLVGHGLRPSPGASPPSGLRLRDVNSDAARAHCGTIRRWQVISNLPVTGGFRIGRQAIILVESVFPPEMFPQKPFDCLAAVVGSVRCRSPYLAIRFAFLNFNRNHFDPLSPGASPPGGVRLFKNHPCALFAVPDSLEILIFLRNLKMYLIPDVLRALIYSDFFIFNPTIRAALMDRSDLVCFHFAPLSPGASPPGGVRGLFLQNFGCPKIAQVGIVPQPMQATVGATVPVCRRDQNRIRHAGYALLVANLVRYALGLGKISAIRFAGHRSDPSVFVDDLHFIPLSPRVTSQPGKRLINHAPIMIFDPVRGENPADVAHGRVFIPCRNNGRPCVFQPALRLRVRGRFVVHVPQIPRKNLLVVFPVFGDAMLVLKRVFHGLFSFQGKGLRAFPPFFLIAFLIFSLRLFCVIRFWSVYGSCQYLQLSPFFHFSDFLLVCHGSISSLKVRVKARFRFENALQHVEINPQVFGNFLHGRWSGDSLFPIIPKTDGVGIRRIEDNADPVYMVFRHGSGDSKRQPVVNRHVIARARHNGEFPPAQLPDDLIRNIDLLFSRSFHDVLLSPRRADRSASVPLNVDFRRLFHGPVKRGINVDAPVKFACVVVVNRYREFKGSDLAYYCRQIFFRVFNFCDYHDQFPPFNLILLASFMASPHEHSRRNWISKGRSFMSLWWFPFLNSSAILFTICFFMASPFVYFYPLPALLPGVRSCIAGGLLRVPFHPIYVSPRVSDPALISGPVSPCLWGGDSGLSMSFFLFCSPIIIILIIMSRIIFIFLVLQGREIIKNVKIIENNFRGCAKKRKKMNKIERMF